MALINGEAQMITFSHPPEFPKEGNVLNYVANHILDTQPEWNTFERKFFLSEISIVVMSHDIYAEGNPESAQKIWYHSVATLKLIAEYMIIKTSPNVPQLPE